MLSTVKLIKHLHIIGAKKSFKKAWSEKYKNNNNLFWRYHRNKRQQELQNSHQIT